ncbi:lipopolysaccharide biosynthesis protein [Planktomarina temperata]|nr:lipopolysaccharide biosynthesis protein [Planktomarina temperata]
MANISARSDVARATRWTVLEFVIGRGLNIVFIAMLARLLTPEDFGIFALLAIFLAVATALIESGFGLALIRNQDATDTDNSTVFWICLATATCIALALAATMPLIAAFFDLAVLVPLTYIMAVTVWISSFGIVQRALLVKRLEFQRLAVINLSALLISSVIAVFLARSEFGVFTLAWQAFASALLTSVLLWAATLWSPTFVFSKSSAKHLFGFGGYMLASKLFDVMYSKSYTVLIGKFDGTVELGQFYRAESTSNLMSGFVVHPISQIAFPAFSHMRGNCSRIRDGLQGAVRASMAFNAVAMFTLAAVAKPFVLTIFGPQWEPSIPLLQVLCLVTLMTPLHVLNLQALMAIGRSDLFFILELIKKAIGIGILVLVSSYGGIGIAWGLVVAGLISFIVNSWYSGRLFNYGPVRQVIQIVPSLSLGIIAAGAAIFAMAVNGTDANALELLAGVGAAATTSIVLLSLGGLLGYDLTGLLTRLRTSSKTCGKGTSA